MRRGCIPFATGRELIPSGPQRVTRWSYQSGSGRIPLCLAHNRDMASCRGCSPTGFDDRLMVPARRRLALALALQACAAGSMLGQSSACLSQPDSVRVYPTMIRDYYANTDSAAVIAAGEPWASPTKIALVTKSATCRAGVTAFNQISGAAGTPQAEAAAYIFTVGGAGFAYFRPGDTTGDKRMFYIFRSDWTYRAAIAG
jgi:hypothetical protein